MRRFTLAFAVSMLAVLAPPGWAGVVVSNGGTVGATWPGSPAIMTYAAPNTPADANRVPENFDNGRVVSQTFTANTTMTLTGITISTVGAGSPTVPLTVHLFDIVNPNSLPGSYNLATDAGPDLFGGGAGLSFFPLGSGGDIFHQFAFDNVGTNDRVTLQAGRLYAFEIWGVAGQTGLLNWIRGAGGISTYTGGDGYTATGGAGSNLRTQLAGGSRDAVLAVYATPVPEPTSLGLVALGTCAALVARRRRRA
jgi:hypothetical protein